MGLHKRPVLYLAARWMKMPMNMDRAVRAHKLKKQQDFKIIFFSGTDYKMDSQCLFCVQKQRTGISICTM